MCTNECSNAVREQLCIRSLTKSDLDEQRDVTMCLQCI